MPYTPTTWADNVTPVDAVRLNNIETGVDDAHTLIDDHLTDTLGFGTALPASPSDGDEYILVDSLTAPTYSWRFRYCAGITGAYKWRFVGGAPRIVEITATEGTTTVGSWIDLATVGPSFIVPRAGDWHVMYAAGGTHTVANTQIWHCAQIGSSGAQAAGLSLTTKVAGVGEAMAAGFHIFPGLVASAEIRLRHYNAAAGTATFFNRKIEVLPVAVS